MVWGTHNLGNLHVYHKSSILNLPTLEVQLAGNCHFFVVAGALLLLTKNASGN
jgi:hypothetical protein